MAADLASQGLPDRSLIHMSDGHEVRYWTKHLGITVECLRLAVDTVGNSAEAVCKYLGKPAHAED